MNPRPTAGFLVLALAAGAAPLRAATPPAVTVGTIVAERRPVAAALEFVGRIEAVGRVDIRARITGTLESVLFKEGGIVAQGAPLFRIEPGTFEAALKQAEGDLAKAQGQQVYATVQRKRAEDLVRTSDIPLSTRDQRVAEEQTSQGQVVVAQAALQTAQINLGYTDISAPIAGKIGKTTFTVGNLVSPDSGTLATIVSVDPIYVTFPVSEREFLALRQRRGSASADQAGKVDVHLTFPDNSVYPHLGVIEFVDVTVDRATDTILVRATMPNPEGVLVDGQLVRVVVEEKAPEQKVLVPQAALIADQQGAYVFVVEDGKAAVRRLKLGAEKGPDMVVEQGLAGGEQVVVQGLQTLRPGVAVTAAPIPPQGPS